MYRGHRTRGEFLKKALQAKARAEGVPEAEIVRIVGKVMHTPLQNLNDVVQLFSQFNPDELRAALGHLVQRVENLESARGATTHFSMVKGAGEDEGLEEVKGVPVEMPKHTKRRDTHSGSAPFGSPQDEDFAQAKGSRKTEFGAPPIQGPVDAPTPPKSKRTGHLEKAVDSDFESPIRASGKPAAKGRFLNLSGSKPAAKPAANKPATRSTKLDFK